jgi:hypothetical protein
MRGLRNRLRSAVWAFAMATGLGTGIALGCSGNGCSDEWQTGCTVLAGYAWHACCRDHNGDGIKNCLTCKRSRYSCAGQEKYGSPYDCGSPGSTCS